MNSSFVCIGALLKNISNKQCLINFLNEVSSQSLRGYLRINNIYGGACNERKSKVIELIVYGWINGKLNNIKSIDDVSNNKTHGIIKELDINSKLLPGHGNMGKRRKDIIGKCSVKITDWHCLK